MTFEEFFKKKRIDLAAFKAGEPALFSEFNIHFEEMGEKSFDHTKKYWFNKLRHLYHLAPELKPEKVIIENKLAEQTIVDNLTEPTPPPSVGFKPRFKPGMVSKPAQPLSDVKDPAPTQSATATPEVNEAAAQKDQEPDFQQQKEAMQQMADTTPRSTADDEAQVAAADNVQKAGYKPRFNMKTVASKPVTDTESAAAPVESKLADTPTPLPTTENAGTKPAYKPRFSMKAVAPKADETIPPSLEENVAVPDNTNSAVEPAAAAAPPKPVGFKPRFNAKNIKPKPSDE